MECEELRVAQFVLQTLVFLFNDFTRKDEFKLLISIKIIQICCLLT